MKIIFFGASKFVIPVIELLNKNFTLALVITTEKDPSDTVPLYCRSRNIECISVSKFDELTGEKIAEIKAPVAALAYFGMILPKKILDIFPYGILNIHPSLLPLYRGATPVQSAILNGDTQTGVTIIRLDEKMDHGPILAQKKVLINQTDTTPILHDSLFKLGADMLINIIPDYLNKKIIPLAQNDKNSTFTKLVFTKNDGFFDINNPPPIQVLDRRVRAYYPWPGVWTRLQINNKESIVKLLPGKNIQVEGKKPISYKDFFNGYPELKNKYSKIMPL